MQKCGHLRHQLHIKLAKPYQPVGASPTPSFLSMPQLAQKCKSARN
jgi:hypothetical protein